MKIEIDLDQPILLDKNGVASTLEDYIRDIVHDVICGVTVVDYNNDSVGYIKPE